MVTLGRSQTIMAPEKNYKSYREQLHKAVGACVPYIGSYLTDLTLYVVFLSHLSLVLKMEIQICLKEQN